MVFGGPGLNTCDFTTGEQQTTTCVYDDSSPVVNSILFDRTTVDVGQSNQTVNVALDVSDATAVQAVRVQCDFPGRAVWVIMQWDTPSAPVGRMSQGNNAVEFYPSIVGNRRSFSVSLPLLFEVAITPGEYSCWVQTVDTLGHNTQSETVQRITIQRTPIGQPSEVQDLRFEATTPKIVTIYWRQPKSLGDPLLVGYVTEYSLDGLSWKILPKSGTEATSLEVFGLKGDTDYWFRVRGENGGTVGQDTTYMNLNWATLKIRTPAAVVSDPPTSLLFSNLTSRGFKLAWGAPSYNGGSPITDFKVELSSDGGQTWRLAKQSASTSLSLNVSGAAPGTNYLVRVGAINSVGVSEYLTDSLKTATTIPTAARTVSASKVAGTSLTLSWLLPSSNGGSAITDYKIEVSSNCSTYTTIKRTVSANLGFKVAGLKPGTKYCFRVSAGNILGFSAPTKAIEVVTQGYAPAAPTSLSVKAAKTSVTLGWKAAAVTGGSAVRNYIVEYSKNNGVSWLKVTKPVSTSRSLTIKGLRSRTTYLFRVTAVNDVGNSKASKSLKVTTG